MLAQWNDRSVWQGLHTVTKGIKNAYLGKLGDYSFSTHWGNQMHEAGLHPPNSVKFYKTENM